MQLAGMGPQELSSQSTLESGHQKNPRLERCAREFDRSNVVQLQVHHRNHNHDDNPADGSNWELLCVYCHVNEHARQLEKARGQASSGAAAEVRATHQPFADLKALLQRKPDK